MTRTTRPDRRRLGLLALGAASVSAAVLAIRTAGSDPGDDPLAALIAAYGTVTYMFVGIVVLWRRPGHGIGRLAIWIGIAFGVGVALNLAPMLADQASSVRPDPPGPTEVLLDLASLVSTALTSLALILSASLLVTWFPDGHRTSRAGGVVELLLVASVTALAVGALRDPILQVVGPSADRETIFRLAGTIGIACVALAYVGACLDLALRYRSAGGPRRIQMGWVLAAEGASIAAALLTFSLGDRIDGLWALWLASMALPGLAIAIAITRYHLYDIDRIVSRSIAYLVLTAILVSVFGALVLGLQALIGGVVARPGTALDPWVVAISTLAVAALFTPARTGVQSVVDRRFNRERYDSARIVAGFSGRLRDQLDLPTVSAELRATTTRALEPATTGVWLRTRTGSR